MTCMWCPCCGQPEVHVAAGVVVNTATGRPVADAHQYIVCDVCPFASEVDPDTGLLTDCPEEVTLGEIHAEPDTAWGFIPVAGPAVTVFAQGRRDS